MHFPINASLFKSIPLKAVDDVSFSVKRGETLGLVGESGCGKTTLGRAILQLYTPTSGEVYFNGKLIRGKKALQEFRRNATIVFQDPYSSLNPRMTVSDIIAEPLEIHHLVKNKQEKEARVAELMETVGLSKEHASRYVHSFSGGQRQRIGIARALASNPQFIMCDEPVSALDVSIQAQILNTFQELQEKFGLTYLFVAHNLLVVKHISDRIAVMYLGHIVELAESEELYENPLHPYTVSLLSAIPEPDPKKARANQRQILEGDLPSPLHAPSGCPFRTRCPRAKEECAEALPSLKEIAPGHFVSCLLFEEKKP
ncbi:MAG: ATP-binding cassette domain-containing protein [Bacilli bacterium]|nr:ATP-binding cassette domain-containing protein [Bacilli bacterium]